MYVFFIAIFLGCVISIDAQCVSTPTDACIPVHQSVLDRAAKAIDELGQAQLAIKALQNVQTATDAERAAYKNLATVSDMAMTILQRGITDRDKVIEMQEKAMQALADLADKLTTKLNAPKSAWKKFAETVQKVVVFAAGVALGRGRI